MTKESMEVRSKVGPGLTLEEYNDFKNIQRSLHMRSYAVGGEKSVMSQS